VINRRNGFGATLAFKQLIYNKNTKLAQGGYFRRGGLWLEFSSGGVPLKKPFRAAYYSISILKNCIRLKRGLEIIKKF
jgi:hypothetical protein